MKCCTAVVATPLFLMSLVGACVGGQTGEEEPPVECKEESRALTTDAATPLGITAEDYFSRLRSRPDVYSPAWGSKFAQDGDLRIDFVTLSEDVRFVDASGVAPTNDVACPDQIEFTLRANLHSTSGDFFAESLLATTRVQADESGRVAANIPVLMLKGSARTALADYSRLSVQLTLAGASVVAGLITAETDDGARTSAVVASWP